MGMPEREAVVGDEGDAKNRQHRSAYGGEYEGLASGKHQPAGAEWCFYELPRDGSDQEGDRQ